MGTDLQLNIGTLYSFLLVLARVSGAFVYVPLPGIRTGPDIARAVFAVSLTLVLFASWPQIDGPATTPGQLIGNKTSVKLTANTARAMSGPVLMPGSGTYTNAPETRASTRRNEYSVPMLS
jgi:hypothetical protein